MRYEIKENQEWQHRTSVYSLTARKEFPSLDMLTTWLLTALKARGGRTSFGQRRRSLNYARLSRPLSLRPCDSRRSCSESYVKDAKKTERCLVKRRNMKRTWSCHPVRYVSSSLPCRSKSTNIGLARASTSPPVLNPTTNSKTGTFTEVARGNVRDGGGAGQKTRRGIGFALRCHAAKRH